MRSIGMSPSGKFSQLGIRRCCVVGDRIKRGRYVRSVNGGSPSIMYAVHMISQNTTVIYGA